MLINVANSYYTYANSLAPMSMFKLCMCRCGGVQNQCATQSKFPNRGELIFFINISGTS